MPTQQLQIVPSPIPSSVRRIHSDEVIEFWPQIREYIASALGEGSYSLSDVARGMLGGGWVLWLIEREAEVIGVCITEILDFPRQRKCLLRYAAGDSIGELNRHEPVIEAYASANGCDVLEAYTRRGMEKLKPGWVNKYVILQKKLI